MTDYQGRSGPQIAAFFHEPSFTVSYVVHDPLALLTVLHVHDGIDEESFAAMREARDAALAMPQLIMPSIQINVGSGNLPAPEDNGRRYLKIPLNSF